MRFLLLALLGMGLMIPITYARPVSYPGGITFMTMNDGDKNSLHLHYSPTAKYSLGYKFEHWRDKGLNLHAIQMNNLIKRWNNKDSQANFYLKSGIGSAHSTSGYSDGETGAVGFTGTALDWENRRFFVSYENRYTNVDGIDDFYTQSSRIGVAPYIGDYGDTHTWLMLQVEHNPESHDNFTVTPLVRFFKDVHLLEAGMNTNGEVIFNYVFRY